jgi:hypothetical protein
MPLKKILGRYNYNLDLVAGVLSDEKIKLLYKVGISRADLSHYKHNRVKKISKKHLQLIEKMESTLILTGKQFIPFAANTQNKREKYLVQRGFNDLSEVQKRLSRCP